ncbi:MAG TPA: hypothetical protein VGE52_11735, partial [Pirellulales bacterium]
MALTSLWNRLRRSLGSARRKPRSTATLSVESLEDRVVFTGTPTVSLVGGSPVAYESNANSPNLGFSNAVVVDWGGIPEEERSALIVTFFDDRLSFGGNEAILDEDYAIYVGGVRITDKTFVIPPTSSSVAFEVRALDDWLAEDSTEFGVFRLNAGAGYALHSSAPTGCAVEIRDDDSLRPTVAIEALDEVIW